MNWPTGHPRTPAGDRRRDRPYEHKAWSALHDDVVHALERIARYSDASVRLLEISTAHEGRHIGARGHPLSHAPEPSDPGVVVWFSLDDATTGVPCDGYVHAQQNARSIINYLHQQARSIRDRVGSVQALFQGFLALPPQSSVTPQAAGEPLAVQEYRRRIAQGQEPAKARRICAAFAHPDQGGSDDDMAALNVAHEQVIRGRDS